MCVFMFMCNNGEYLYSAFTVTAQSAYNLIITLAGQFHFESYYIETWHTSKNIWTKDNDNIAHKPSHGTVQAYLFAWEPYHSDYIFHCL